MIARFARWLICFACCLLAAGPLQAATRVLDTEHPPLLQNPLTHVPAAPEPAKTVTDTINLIGPWGSGSPVNGQFQDTNGMPAWNGWTSHDLTSPENQNWHVSNFMEPEGNLSLYCGDELMPACDATDPVGGYGNNWNDQIEYRYQVPDPGADCLMSVSGVLSHSTEEGYDFVEMDFFTADGPVLAQSYDGEGEGIPFEHSFTYQPDDYLGDQQDEVAFRLVFESDGGYSDADCLFTGSGACRVDNILVNCSNGDHTYFHDFQDGTLGLWEALAAPGVGDFTGLWQNLEDLDPCQTNYSPQVAWIDDGTQVEGVGPSTCISWCYGPGGFVVNTTGGALGPEGHLNNVVRSPVIEWDGTQFDGGVLSCDVYRHEDPSTDSPGIFYTWSIRSAANAQDLEAAPWVGNNVLNFGGPDYVRLSEEVSPWLVPGAEAVQIQLGLWELGWVWGYEGNDGTPAPYFDNVSLKAFDCVGPHFHSSPMYQAQDAFPGAGSLNLEDLAANNVRFDMAYAYPGSGYATVPGDSITVRITPSRPGAEIVQADLHYTMRPNPLFDEVRDPAFGVTGTVTGYPVPDSHDPLYNDTFFFDLPDSGFLFPGDIIHYYISATESGGGIAPESATCPEDLSGYGLFTAPHMYNSDFVMRALPTLGSPFGDQPRILFWDDSSGHDDGNLWFWALRNLGFEQGVDYDRFVTKGASYETGGGLGSRCNVDLLDGYFVLLYTAGDLSSSTLCDGQSYEYPSPDIPLLNDWLALGNHYALLMGDNLASGLVESGPMGASFVEEVMGVHPIADDIRPLIGSQNRPLVVPVSPNPVFFVTPSWLLNGGCPGRARFDAIEPTPGAVRLAEFTSPAGNPGYPYAAAVSHTLDNGSRVLSLPCSFGAVTDGPEHPAFYPNQRTQLLREVLTSFGLPSGGFVVPVPGRHDFQLASHPNPFNPSTRIDFHLPQDGPITVEVFNLRGELVTTLLDESRAAGPGHIRWDGKDSGGTPVSSGLYFCKAQTAGQVKLQKMTLLK